MNQHLTTLRDYQKDVITRTYESMRSHRKTMLQMATGSGKSHVAAAIMEMGLAKGKRIGFLIDRIVLGDQITDRLFSSGLPVSVVQGQHPLWNPNKPLQVCSVQTLARRRETQWPAVDLWIMDEAHLVYDVVNRMMAHRTDIPWLGLSATPFTRGLGLIWDNLVVGSTTKQLIEQGYLCDYEAYGPDTPNLIGVRRSGGDWSPADLEGRMNEITGSVVKHYMDRGRKPDGSMMKALAFTPTVAYSQHLADEFRKNGIDADHVSGHDTDVQREDKMARYKSGEIQVMTNCDVLTRGFDMGDIEYGILARPTRSLSLHIQMLGRFLRTSPGKDKALIMDHAGNIERLGFPDDDLPTRLDSEDRSESDDTREEDDEEREPRNCPQCHHLMPAGTVQCAMCGHVIRKPIEVEVKSGILTKLTNPNVGEKQNKQEIYSQLLHIADARGYSRGWTAHKYRELFEVWPRGMVDVLAQPSEGLQGWITHKNIAWAKRKHG
jgi:DNA repair protein RadD